MFRFRTLFGSRRSTITTLIVAAAFVICWLAWMRFFAVAALNPSPARYVEFVAASGEQEQFRQVCSGPAFSQGHRVWRYCQYAPGDFMANGAAAQWGLVRFDLDAGKAELDWPLPESPDAQILALAESPLDDLAVAWGSPDLAAVYLVLNGGGVVSLDVPPAAADVVGLAWHGDALELVAAAGPAATIHTNEAGVWAASRAIPAPDACDQGAVCAVQMAYRGDSGWQVAYAVAGAVADGPAATGVDLLLIDESGDAQPLESVALTDLAAGHTVRDDAGALVGLGQLLDRAPGNAVNWLVDSAPFVLRDGVLERVPAPLSNASFYFSNYVIESGGLRWIPGVRYPQRGWHVDEWLTLQSSGDGIALARMGGGDGPVLTNSTPFFERGGTQAGLLPAAGGGYWVLGPYGAYMKVNEALERADGLSLPERIMRAFENFGRLEPVSNSFYHETRLLKMAAFPIVLLSLPTGYLLVFFVRQTRKDRRTWVRLLVEISAVYVVLATVFVWWFWELMGDF